MHMIAAQLPTPCLMLLVETTMPGGGPVLEIVEQAIAGGVNTIQLRDKTTLPEELHGIARSFRDIAAGRAMVVINDSPEIARDLNLDGVHLPEAAFDLDRLSFPRQILIGRSVHSVKGAAAAEVAGVDYVVAGNIYETHSHPGKDGEGLNFLTAICEAVSLPVLAIGGITPENTAACIGAGASGIVARSGILLSRDPRAAASKYAAALIPQITEAQCNDGIDRKRRSPDRQ